MHLAVFSYGHLERLKLLVFFNHIRLGSKRLSTVLTSTWKSWSTVSSVPPRAREGNAESDEASSEPPAVSPPRFLARSIFTLAVHLLPPGTGRVGRPTERQNEEERGHTLRRGNRFLGKAGQAAPGQERADRHTCAPPCAASPEIKASKLKN